MSRSAKRSHRKSSSMKRQKSQCENDEQEPVRPPDEHVESGSPKHQEESHQIGQLPPWKLPKQKHRRDRPRTESPKRTSPMQPVQEAKIEPYDEGGPVASYKAVLESLETSIGEKFVWLQEQLQECLNVDKRNRVGSRGEPLPPLHIFCGPEMSFGSNTQQEHQTNPESALLFEPETFSTTPGTDYWSDDREKKRQLAAELLFDFSKWSSKHQPEVNSSFKEQMRENSIIILGKMGSSFLSAIDTHLLENIKLKYFVTMEASGANMLQLMLLLKSIHYVRLLPSKVDTIYPEKVTTVGQLLYDSMCTSLEELEETMKSHIAFRLILREYFHAREYTTYPAMTPPEHLSSSDQLKSNVESVNQQLSLISMNDHKDTGEHPTYTMQLDNTQVGKDLSSDPRNSSALIQPFYGDSSVRPKENKYHLPQSDSPENTEDKQIQAGKWHSHGPEIPVSETTVGHSEVSREPTGHQEASVSEDMFDLPREWFLTLEQELQIRMQSAPDSENNYSLIILEGIKHNFDFADLINRHFAQFTDTTCVQDEPNAKMESFREMFFKDSTQYPTAETDLSVTSHPQAALLTNESASAGSTIEDQHKTDLSNLSALIETKADSISKTPADPEETWQSRNRTFVRNKLLNRPLAERLGPRPKNIKFNGELCPNCRNIYRWPHILHCFHRFCFPCIVKLYQAPQRCFKCPICNCPTEERGNHRGPLYMHLDRAMCRDMIEADMYPFCCTLCPNNEDAVKYCTSCHAFLCHECCKLHLKSESTSAHRLVRSDAMIGAKPTGELWSMCFDHPGIFITKFCSQCERPVCDICCSGEHKSHHIKEIADAAVGAAEKMKFISAEIIDVKNAYHSSLMNLNQSKQRLEAIHRSERHKITDMGNKFKEKIAEYRKKATQLLDETFDKLSAQAVTANREREQFQRYLVAFNQFASRYLQLGEKKEVVAMYPLIKQRYLQLLNIYETNPHLREGFTADVNFDPKYPEVTDTIHEVFSSLKVKYECFLTHMLESPLVRERHHVEPYRPLPYSIDYRTDNENAPIGARGQQQVSTDANFIEDDALKGFFRTTLSYSRAFGRYGRGEYEFSEPSGISYLHDGSLAVCDTRNHRIVVYNEDGKYTRTIGQPSNIPDLPAVPEDVDRTFPRTEGKLYFPFRLAQCRRTYNIVVLERPPSLDIQIFTFKGEFVRCFGNSLLQNPRAITVDERGMILILESKTMNFFIFTPEGELINRYVLGTLEFPNDVTTFNDVIYISDNRLHCVRCFDYSLNYKKDIGNESLTYYPISAGFDYAGQLVVTDNHNTFNITVFDINGMLIAGFKSRAKHANCYNVALNPTFPELAVTTRECQVLIFTYADISSSNESTASH